MQQKIVTQKRVAIRKERMIADLVNARISCMSGEESMKETHGSQRDSTAQTRATMWAMMDSMKNAISKFARYSDILTTFERRGAF